MAKGTEPLGNAFSTGGAQDLVFRYRTSGGAFVDAAVQYITVDGLSGDYNNNGLFDAADYVVWRNNVGPGSLPNEGGISPGMVDAEDYNFWRSRSGRTSGSGAGVGESAVPEPSTMLVFLVSVVVCTLIRTQRTQAHLDRKTYFNPQIRGSQTVGGTN